MFRLAITLIHLSIQDVSMYGKKYRVTSATICLPFFICIAPLKFFQSLSQIFSISVPMSGFSGKLFFFTISTQPQRRNGCVHCGTKFKRSNLGQHTNRCSLGSQFCTQCPNFSTVAQTNLILLLQFPQMTCKNQLHVFITSVRCY